MEEKGLVKRAKRGDVDAFGELYGMVYRKLYQFALYTLRNSQDAEDVVSDTVTDAFESIRKLKSEEAFSSWIFQILSNKCRRKMRDYYKDEVSLEDPEADKRQMQQSGLEVEDAVDLKQTFFQLEGDERLIVGMHIFLGYKTREIAVFMDMNENTVRSKESRALKKMGKIISEGESEYGRK